MKFGKWTVSKEGIVNNGNTIHRFFIPKTSLDSFIDHEERMYRWLLEVVKLEQLSLPTIEAFNKVFIYSFGKYNFPFDEKIYIASIKKQNTLLALRRIKTLNDSVDFPFSI